jgi:hypothetical protein
VHGLVGVLAPGLRLPSASTAAMFAEVMEKEQRLRKVSIGTDSETGAVFFFLQERRRARFFYFLLIGPPVR